VRALIRIEATWTPHATEDELPDDFLDDLAAVLIASPEALAEFLDRDEVSVIVEGEWG
jgi:hypothetical protein